MDILGLGLPITKVPYFEGAPSSPGEVGPAGTNVLWFDWTDRGTLTLSGDLIETVDNKATVTPWDTYKLTTTASQEPSLVSGGQNNLSYSSHNGTDKAYTLTDANGGNISVPYGQDYTLVVVQDNDASGSTVSGMTGGRTPNGYAFRWSGATLIGTVYAQGGNASDSLNPVETSEYDFGVAIQTVDNANDEIEVIFNGVAPNSPGAIVGDPVNTVSNLFVGKANTAGQFYTGKIYEFMLYKAALTDVEIAQLHAYITNKYNFPI